MGAAVEYKNQSTDNLVITVTDARLEARIGMTVEVDGVFTFTVSALTQANASDPIGFTIGNTGSVDLTVGLTPATTLALTGVTATVATSDVITLSATANLTQAQATALLRDFRAGVRSNGTCGYGNRVYCERHHKKRPLIKGLSFPSHR